MTPENDEELATLLTDTFASREYLVDPERAVELATSARRRRRTRPALLSAAAVVVLVAAGTTYALTRGSHGDQPTAGPGSSSTVQSRSAGAVTRANRAFAERIADDALKQLRDRAAQLPGGATEVGANRIPALEHLNAFIGTGAGQGFTRSAFYLASGRAHQVALWFAAHPPANARSEGGPNGVGGSRNRNGSWSDEVDYDYPLARRALDRASLASMVQVTPSGGGMGIRFTVFGASMPGRPGASFAPGVREVRILVTDTVSGPNGGHGSHRSWTLTSQSQFQGIVSHFDALPGGAPTVLSCPAPMATRSYRITFDTTSGTVLAQGSAGCGAAVQVSRDGHDVPPMLEGSTFYPYVDQVLSLPPLP